MTVGEILAAAATRLDRAGVASPQVDAELLMSHVTGVSRAMLRFAEPSPADLRTFHLLVDRRESREPLQHLTGKAPFRYIEVEVGPGVFIPRPETELLTGWAIDELARHSAPLIVDLCTGSGVIAAAIAHESPHSNVYAVELEMGAFNYAQRNLRDSGVDVRQGDIAVAFTDLNRRVDVVVANPPYIPLEAWESVDSEARDFDPELALWSGADGLEAIRVVEEVARRLLKPGGKVGCEHADVQGDSAPNVFARLGYWSGVRDNLDLADRPRFVTATRTSG